MRQEATLEQWKELYDIAIEIKELKPWEHLWDMDIITLIMPGHEPVMCSIMGAEGQFYGIGAYIGYEAISNFFEMASEKSMPQDQMIRYHEDGIIMCYFGSREDLTSKELKLIKDLGLKFRGKNNWIFFHSMKRGYMPYILDHEEIKLAIEIFKNLRMALRAYIEEGLEVDFDAGKTLMRIYDEEKGAWLSFEAPFPEPAPEYFKVNIMDKKLLKQLKEQEINDDVWELDISFLKSHITDKQYERPVAMKMCILADEDTGAVLDYTLLKPEDNYAQILLDTFIDAILKFGRPYKLLTRDKFHFFLLGNLCGDLGVDIEIGGYLDAIDSFLVEFERFNY
ncbi:MAG: hypothetical protein GX352_05885 [Clostridiales bacterium]|nr:hypothetical protein [Clostridiales bacterium]